MYGDKLLLIIRELLKKSKEVSKTNLCHGTEGDFLAVWGTDGDVIGLVHIK